MEKGSESLKAVFALKTADLEDVSEIGMAQGKIFDYLSASSNARVVLEKERSKNDRDLDRVKKYGPITKIFGYENPSYYVRDNILILELLNVHGMKIDYLRTLLWSANDSNCDDMHRLAYFVSEYFTEYSKKIQQARGELSVFDTFADYDTPDCEVFSQFFEEQLQGIQRKYPVVKQKK